MTEWALPPRKAATFGNILHQLEREKNEHLLQFMRGGFWRNFLVRYSEVNNQHKKMLRVHDHVYAAGATPESGVVHLWKAQANDTYWHGLFGGIYMAHVRSAIYHHLIKAENAADRINHGSQHWQQYEFTDFDRDTHNELIIESDQQNLYIDPRHGGSIFEWDMRRSAHNMTSVMTRREESYHQMLREHEQERRRLKAQASVTQQTTPSEQSESEPASPHTAVRTKEDGLDQYLVVDGYRRNSLIDHFLPAGLPLQAFAQGLFEEQGSFVDYPYITNVEQDANGLTVHMTCDGWVRRVGALSPVPVGLSKTLFIPIGEEKLVVRYSIENNGQSRLQTYFASEWNLNVLGGGKNDQAYCHVADHELEDEHFDSTDEVFQVESFQVGNTWLQQDTTFSLSEPATLWRFSIDTVTGSEAGFERTHQGSCLTMIWQVVLDAGTKWSTEVVCIGKRPD
jgi:alpha-amylase